MKVLVLEAYLFRFNHLRTVLVETVLRHVVQCAQSAMQCIVESDARSDSRRLHSSMNLGAEINKQLQLLFATTINTKITSQLRPCRVKLALNVIELNDY